MTNAFAERYPDADFEPSELEVAQSERLNELEAELAEFRAQAANPASAAVEQPAALTQQSDVVREAYEAMNNAANPAEATVAAERYRALVEGRRPQVVTFQGTPAEARAAAEPLDGESRAAYTERLRGLGLVTR